jgi:excisionase family DNA binding protein
LGGTWEGSARITTQHSASNYGIPILLVEGEPIGTAEAALVGYQIIEASTAERRALARGGYHLPDALLDSAEAARALGVSKSRIQALVRLGRLPAVKVGSAWAIRPADLELVRVRRPGRPRTRKATGGRKRG